MATLVKAQQDVPDHVPADRVWDHDFEAFATSGDDPFRKLGELHDGPEILWVRNLGPGLGGGRAGWLLTRYALIREILSDTENFTSCHETNLLSAIGIDWPLIPLELDQPQHTMYRKVLEPFFSPASINALDDAIRHACEELIAGFANKDACEFVGEFAEKFPSHIFLDLMGMPRAQLSVFLDWERNMLRGKPDEMVAAMTSILDYLQKFIEEQNENPKSDLMKGIVSARLPDGRPLTTSEKVSICYLLYIGGLDTVYSTITWIFWHLAQDPALQQRLREHPEDTTRAAEELLRAFSAASTGRRAKRDLDFHGVQIRAGDRLIGLLSLASRDPEAYENPHVIDIDRKPRHIAFGTGPHTCLGIRLAKREIKIVLETLLARFQNIRIPAGERHEFHVGSVFGLDRLPLQWDRLPE